MGINQRGNIFDMKNMAHFGENLILSDICEKDICVGDILKIGQTRVQITQPRQPCWKLSANTNEKSMKYSFGGRHNNSLHQPCVLRLSAAGQIDAGRCETQNRYKLLLCLLPFVRIQYRTSHMKQMTICKRQETCLYCN